MRLLSALERMRLLKEKKIVKCCLGIEGGFKIDGLCWHTNESRWREKRFPTTRRIWHSFENVPESILFRLLALVEFDIPVAWLTTLKELVSGRKQMSYEHLRSYASAMQTKTMFHIAIANIFLTKYVAIPPCLRWRWENLISLELTSKRRFIDTSWKIDFHGLRWMFFLEISDNSWHKHEWKQSRSKYSHSTRIWSESIKHKRRRACGEL